jgi:hypothetical protein
MRTMDHAALGRLLLDEAGTEELRRHRMAFLFGCVEPDRNFLTYLRGSLRHSPLRGHHAENSQAYIARQLGRLERRGLGSAYRCFVLGTLLHYIADEFTYAHNAVFPGSLRDHVRYEHEMHPYFTAELERQRGIPWLPGSPDAILSDARAAYCANGHTMQSDCRYIIRVCSVVLQKLAGAACAPAVPRPRLCAGNL